MKAVFILISLVMVQLAQMEESKSQVKVVPDSGGGGANIVKSLEREIREAKKGKDKNSKSKGKKRPTKRTKNKGKKKGKGENSRKEKQDKKKNVKSKGFFPSKTGRKKKGKKKGKGENSRKEKQDKRKNVKSKGRKPSKTVRKNKGKNKKDKKASKYKKKINNKKVDKSNTAGKGKNSKKGKKVKKGKKSTNVKSKGGETANNERKNKGKKKKGKKANKVSNGNRKASKGTNNGIKVKQAGTYNCTCPLEVLLKPIKKFTKYRNSLANLKRISVWWKLLKNKQNKARTTFQNASEAISEATFNGTSCRGGSVPPEAETAFKVLRTCNKTAVDKCDRDDINLTIFSTDCNQSPSCSAEATNPECNAARCSGWITPKYKKASCATATRTTDCLTTSKFFKLTDAMVDFINSTCIPELDSWTSRYKACTSKTTYPNCSITCQTDMNKFQCQKDACLSCTGGADCTFDKCLSANYSDASALIGCQCACYNSIDTEFPISTQKFGGLNCFELVKFERRVKMRRDRCLKPTKGALSGNFVDCRQQERTSIFWINFCKHFNCDCVGIATKAPSTSGRNRFLAQMKNFHLQKRSAGGN